MCRRTKKPGLQQLGALHAVYKRIGRAGVSAGAAIGRLARGTFEGPQRRANYQCIFSPTCTLTLNQAFFCTRIKIRCCRSPRSGASPHR